MQTILRPFVVAAFLWGGTAYGQTSMNSEIAPAGKFRVGMNGNNGTLTIKNLEQAGAKGVRAAP